MKTAVEQDFRKSRVRDDARSPVTHRMARVGKSSLIPLWFCLTLAGCAALTREAPIRQTFLLEPPAPALVAHPQSAALRVGTINVAAPFRGKTFVHRVGDLRFETDYYVEFLVPPATMLGEQTARALQQAKPFARVAGPGSATDASYVLDGFASELYADMREAGKPAAELDITYYLTPALETEQTPVWSHEYRQRTPMRNASAAAFAEALNQAFGDIVGALARDLASVKLPARDAGAKASSGAGANVRAE